MRPAQSAWHRRHAGAFDLGVAHGLVIAGSRVLPPTSKLNWWEWGVLLHSSVCTKEASPRFPANHSLSEAGATGAAIKATAKPTAWPTLLDRSDRTFWWSVVLVEIKRFIWTNQGSASQPLSNLCPCILQMFAQGSDLHEGPKRQLHRSKFLCRTAKCLDI